MSAMKVGAPSLGSVAYALIVALVLVGGTLAGGALYESANPRFERIVWIEQDAASPSANGAVRRVLFADGRYLALSEDGYRAGILDRQTTDTIFATVRTGAQDWHGTYDAAGVTGERIELAFGGRAARRVAITNPGMNPAVPDDLERVLRSLSAADRGVATTPFAVSSFVFYAARAGQNAGMAETFPVGFPLTDAERPDGVTISGSDLAIVKSMWTDIDRRLEPADAHRLASLDGQTWQISWRLDVDGIGPLRTSAGAR